MSNEKSPAQFAEQLITFAQAYHFDISEFLKLLKGRLPAITDDECRRLALVTPNSYNDIRHWFPCREPYLTIKNFRLPKRSTNEFSHIQREIDQMERKAESCREEIFKLQGIQQTCQEQTESLREALKRTIIETGGNGEQQDGL